MAFRLIAQYLAYALQSLAYEYTVQHSCQPKLSTQSWHKWVHQDEGQERKERKRICCQCSFRRQPSRSHTNKYHLTNGQRKPENRHRHDRHHPAQAKDYRKEIAPNKNHLQMPSLRTATNRSTQEKRPPKNNQKRSPADVPQHSDGLKTLYSSAGSKRKRMKP